MATYNERISFIDNVGRYNIIKSKENKTSEDIIFLQTSKEIISTIELFNIMNSYSQNRESLKSTTEYLKAIRSSFSKYFILPSGLKGLPIALAIETQLFDIALDLITKYSFCEIDSLIAAYDNDHQYTLKELYEENVEDFNENVEFSNPQINKTYQNKIDGNNTLKKLLI